MIPIKIRLIDLVAPVGRRQKKISGVAGDGAFIKTAVCINLPLGQVLQIERYLPILVSLAGMPILGEDTIRIAGAITLHPKGGNVTGGRTVRVAAGSTADPGGLVLQP